MTKLFDELNEKTFEAYGIRNYQNPQCLSIEEFQEDLARFKYVKRLLRKYRETGQISERLVLNHLIAIYNVFTIQAANRMILYKIDEDLWPALKSFLLYLDYLPEPKQLNLNNDAEAITEMHDVIPDIVVAMKLRSI